MTEAINIPPYLTLKGLQRQHPAHPGVNTTRRFINPGISFPSGEVVRLKAVYVGSRAHTTLEWFEEFISETTRLRLGDSPRLSDRRASEDAAAAEYIRNFKSRRKRKK